MKKKPAKPPAGLALKALTSDPTLKAMRASHPGATNAELLAAVQLYVGVPGMSPQGALARIVQREKGLTPLQGMYKAMEIRPAPTVAPRTPSKSWFSRLFR
jgi:hypothetical protein